MNYLQLVNRVLVKLREPQVSSVSDNTYSALIGVFVNEAKAEVENAYDWLCLATTFTVTTTEGVFNYVLTGSGVKFRVVTAINDTTDAEMMLTDQVTMSRGLLRSGSAPIAPPYRYAFNGVDSNGDTQVDLYPIPGADASSVLFDVILPQAELTDDTDVLTVNWELVVANAYARALVERGEDQGLSSSEAYGQYKSLLGDYVSIEESRTNGEQDWRVN